MSKEIELVKDTSMFLESMFTKGNFQKEKGVVMEQQSMKTELFMKVNGLKVTDMEKGSSWTKKQIMCLKANGKTIKRMDLGL